MYIRVLDAVAAVPGVQSASFAMCGVQSRCAQETGFIVEGYQRRPDEEIAFNVNAVTAGYFSTVGMPLIAGRALNEEDVARKTGVAVVNKSLAARYFGEWHQALGRHFGLTTADVEIVGIVADARSLDNLKEPIVPRVYVPLSQRLVTARALEVRTADDPAAAIAGVRRAIVGAAPELPIESVVTVEERIDRGLSRERLLVSLTSAFGALALSLAGFGLFGVLSHAVARRTSEFGLRMALGASPSRVLWDVVSDALRLVVFGVLLGMPFVFLAGNLVSTLVFGISPHDAVSLICAIAVLAGVGAACSLVPALRAARVDPVVAISRE
jgi:predicted permease